MRRRILVVAVAFTLVTAACSGGSSDKASSNSGGSKLGSDPANAEAPDSATEGYTVTGTLVADDGFRPETDGFGVENYGANINGAPAANMTSAEVRKLFGDGVCVDAASGQCDLIPEAQKWMEHENSDMSGGHCYGFSVASLLFWKKQQALADFGGDSTPALPVASDAAIQHQIAYAFEYQTLDSVRAGQVSGTPNQILDKLIADLKPDAPETYTIGIFKADGTGGHAVTPFAVEDKGDGKMNILIYDNNYPKITRAITVDRNANTWTYDASINPNEPSEVYAGDAATKSLSLSPTSPGLATQACPFCNKSAPDGGVIGSAKAGSATAAPTDQIYLDGSDTDHGHLLITNPAGQRIGYADGKLVNEIPGARVDRTFADQDWKLNVEPDYYVPDGPDYTITVDGKGLQTEDDSTLGIISPDSDLSVDNLKLQPGETDTLKYSQDDGVMSFVSDHPQAPTFTFGASDENADYAFTLQGASDVAGETLSFGLPPGGGTFKLGSTGGNGADTYTIMLDREDASTTHFKNDSVKLEPGDSAVLKFGSWDAEGQTIPLVTTHDGADTTRDLPDQS